MNSYLVVLHIYLKCKGITTYEYVLMATQPKIKKYIQNTNDMTNITNTDINSNIKDMQMLNSTNQIMINNSHQNNIMLQVPNYSKQIVMSDNPRIESDRFREDDVY